MLVRESCVMIMVIMKIMMSVNSCYKCLAPLYTAYILKKSFQSRRSSEATTTTAASLIPYAQTKRMYIELYASNNQS